MSNNIGDRNRKLIIKRRVGGVDDANQPIDEFVEVMRRWGKPLTASGMSSVRASIEGVNVAPVRYSWRINYTPEGIDTGMIAEYQGIVFDIQEVRHDHGGREYTDLVCEQGANNG